VSLGGRSVIIPLVSVAHPARLAPRDRVRLLGHRRRRRIFIAIVQQIIVVVVVVVVVKRPRQLVRVLHLGVGIYHVRNPLVLEPLAVTLEEALVGAHGDAAGTPLGARRTAAGTGAVVYAGPRRRLVVVVRGGALLVSGVGVLGKALVAKDAAQQPAAAHVVGVDDAAVAELDALAGPVHPGKVNVEGRLDDTEDDRDGVGMPVVGVEHAEGPVEQVERAVGAKEDDVKGRDDGGNGRLAEEEELREDTDGLEDLGEGPEPLGGLVERTAQYPSTGRGGKAHLSKVPGLAKDHHDDGGENQAAEEDDATQLPSDLTLPCSRIDEAHYPEGVEGRKQVEDLEKVVPWPGFREEVGVSRDEDGRVKDLGDEGDT